MIRLRLLRRSVRPCALAFLFAVASLAPVRSAEAVGGIGDLFITSDASDQVRAYQGPTGTYLGVFTLSTLGNGELGIHFGNNGRVLVGHMSGGVDEYDAATGGYIKTYGQASGWQWTGVYAPNGNVHIGSHGTNDIREYDSTTGAYIATLCALPTPSDMVYGPNGNLYVGSYYFSQVYELDPNTLATVSSWSLPGGGLPNDIAFLPGGRILVTAQGTVQCHVYDASHNLLTSFAGTGWVHPHGITISPYTGNILVVDGVTTQVHEFDPTTYAELNPAYLSANPGDKIVDLAFRPDHQGTPATPTTWGRVKATLR